MCWSYHFGPYSDWPEGQGWACPETELLHKGLLRDDDPVVDTYVVHTKQDHFFLINTKKIQLGQTQISKNPKPCNYIPHPSASINCGKNIVIPHKSPSFPSWPVVRLMISSLVISNIKNTNRQLTNRKDETINVTSIM